MKNHILERIVAPILTLLVVLAELIRAVILFIIKIVLYPGIFVCALVLPFSVSYKIFDWYFEIGDYNKALIRKSEKLIKDLDE